MPNNEGKQKYIVTVTVQCNAVSVGALRTIYKFSGILRKFDQFKLSTMVVFDWAISWSTFNSWSTFRIRLVLHEIPWSTKDVRRNACDIFRS